MFRLLLLTLTSLLSSLSFAQSSVWQKTTPLVREAARAGQRAAQQAKTLGSPAKERTLMAFVKTEDGQESALGEYGAGVHYQHNGVASLSCPSPASAPWSPTHASSA